MATCAADGFLKIHDIRTPGRPANSIQASPTDVLSCDWNKYDQVTIATCGKDMIVRVFDMRGKGVQVGELRGHTLAVRKVQWV